MGLNEKFFRSADEDEPFFNTVLYTGNGGTNEVTGVGFQPDLVWIKRRNGTGDPGMVDTLRGNNSALFTNSTSAESALTGGNISMDIDGFDINTYGSTWVNLSSGTYAAWCFKAGGAPSGSDTVSIDGTSYADEAAAGLTAGTIAVSGLSVNTDLGFSIVKYTGTTGADDVGHGLDVAPDLVIAKTLDSSDSNSNWIAYASPSSGQRGILNGTQSFSASTTHFRADPDSTVLKLSSDSSSNVNRSGDEHIAYCFASKRGVSKVGSYKGTGAAGNKVYTGFEPAFLLQKETNTPRPVRQDRLSKIFASSTFQLSEFCQVAVRLGFLFHLLALALASHYLRGFGGAASCVALRRLHIGRTRHIAIHSLLGPRVGQADAAHQSLQIVRATTLATQC